MRKLFSGILTLLIFAPACMNTEANTTEQEIATIKAISADRAKAFNEGNAAGIAKYFADDACLMAPDYSTKRGPAAVQAYYQSIFDEYKTELESGYEEVKVDGRLAYGRGFAKVKLIRKKDGQQFMSTSKYINILEKRDGRWITTHDIWNGNEPQQ